MQRKHLLAASLLATAVAAFALGATTSASVLDTQTGPRPYQGPTNQYNVVTVTGPELLAAAGAVAGTNIGAEGTWYASNMCFMFGEVTYTFYWGDATDTTVRAPTVPLLKTVKASHTYNAPGMYHLYVLAFHPSGCNSWSAPFVVNVGAAPTAL